MAYGSLCWESVGYRFDSEAGRSSVSPPPTSSVADRRFRSRVPVSFSFSLRFRWVGQHLLSSVMVRNLERASLSIGGSWLMSMISEQFLVQCQRFALESTPCSIINASLYLNVCSEQEEEEIRLMLLKNEIRSGFSFYIYKYMDNRSILIDTFLSNFIHTNDGVRPSPADWLDRMECQLMVYTWKFCGYIRWFHQLPPFLFF